MSMSCGLRPDSEECDRKVYLLRKDIRRFKAMFRRLHPRAKKALHEYILNSKDDGNSWAMAMESVVSLYARRRRY